MVAEFHADHQKVVQALMDLREAIGAREPARVRATLDQANELIGPHFKFEALVVAIEKVKMHL